MDRTITNIQLIILYYIIIYYTLIGGFDRTRFLYNKCN